MAKLSAPKDEPDGSSALTKVSACSAASMLDVVGVCAIIDGRTSNGLPKFSCPSMGESEKNCCCIMGSTDAATINEVSRYLSGLVRSHDLPQKLLVVHRFTGDMIENEEQLERHAGVALVVNVDGFGDQPNKISKYNEFTRGKRDRHHGFKLFHREDVNLMKPREVLRLRPQPDLVVYE